MRRIWILIVLFAWFPAANAATKYVMDTIYIALRAAEGDSAQVVKTLKSGESMEVLEDKGDFLLVKTAAGDEGWVRSRYVQDEPIAEQKLTALSDKYSRLQEENSQLKSQLADVRKEMKELSKNNKDLEGENKKLSKSLAHVNEVAGKPLEISKQNTALKESNEAMQKQLQDLQLENAKYQETGSRDWFLAGAGVIVLGVIMGLIIPRIRWRRRSEWA